MKFSGPHCQQHLEADESFIGTTVDCPVCSQPIFIEAPQPPVAPPPLPEPLPSPEPAQPHEEPHGEEQHPSIPSCPPPPQSDPPEALPPPVEAPRKTAPKFRVVSRPPARTASTKKKTPEAGSESTIEDKVRKSATTLHNKFNDFTGLEKIEGFSLSELFSEIFGKHKPEDIEEFFTVGTPRATPPIDQVDTSWPKPWLFFRALAASIVLYLAFNGGYDYFNNANLIPGMMLMGTLAVPFSTLLFFYEVNARRNISLYQVIRLFFLGGILSLLISLVFFQFHGKLPGASASELAYWAWVGPIEETGKLLALVVVARSMHYHYKLNGLLMGAAIGTGFAVFESMGYALRGLISAEKAALVQTALHGASSVSSVARMKDIIFLRGVLSPLGHIVWTAIAGAALWRVKGKQPFRFGMMKNGKFWHLFLVPVILHSLWDMPIPYIDNLPFYGKYILLGFVAWFVVIALVQEGLKELRGEKLAAAEQMREDAAVSGGVDGKAGETP